VTGASASVDSAGFSAPEFSAADVADAEVDAAAVDVEADGVLVAVESSLPQAPSRAAAVSAAAQAPTTRVERERVRAGM
ncbi:MAG: hypothetical protein WAX14_01995, partial [Rhodococcus sp. (in: high G+C Gram-positive bacteria)]|uniref:hypothetical protein n=1 Tax=Rhodococcus sp. TaxID=1831 RepID=UPI003BB4E0DC